MLFQSSWKGNIIFLKGLCCFVWVCKQSFSNSSLSPPSVVDLCCLPALNSDPPVFFLWAETFTALNVFSFLIPLFYFNSSEGFIQPSCLGQAEKLILPWECSCILKSSHCSGHFQVEVFHLLNVCYGKRPTYLPNVFDCC